MTRYLCCLAVLGVGLVPDWATAYHPCWCPPPPPCVPAYPPQFYLIPHPAPVYEVPLPPPTVHRVPAAAATRPQATPTPAPAPEPVQPAVNTTPKLPEPPPLVVPKTPASDVPPLVLPDEPKAAPKTSPLVLPDAPAPKGVQTAPLAVPSPAPPPTDAIPPLVLPPDLPTGPSGVIPPTTARSSPISAARPRVEVFPAAGAAAGALRKVGFFNHTDRDVRLKIEGRDMLLPAKNYLHAQLPPVFRWSEAGGPERRTAVPADAAGVDVLFRAE